MLLYILMCNLRNLNFVHKKVLYDTTFEVMFCIINKYTQFSLISYS